MNLGEFNGEYIIQEFVRFPEISDTDDCTCNEDSNDCPSRDVDAWAYRNGLYDCHEENFRWDTETKTAWIIDMGM